MRAVGGEHPLLELGGDDRVGLIQNVAPRRTELGELLMVDARAEEEGLEFLDVPVALRVGEREQLVMLARALRPEIVEVLCLVVFGAKVLGGKVVPEAQRLHTVRGDETRPRAWGELEVDQRLPPRDAPPSPLVGEGQGGRAGIVVVVARRRATTAAEGLADGPCDAVREGARQAGVAASWGEGWTGRLGRSADGGCASRAGQAPAVPHSAACVA